MLRASGVGVCFLNGRGVWCLFVRASEGVRLRMSLDDFETVGVHEYQRVRLRLPGEGEVSLFLSVRFERPPFVWLHFAADVRRVAG